MYNIQFTKQAEKDAIIITRVGLKQKAMKCLKIAGIVVAAISFTFLAGCGAGDGGNNGNRNNNNNSTTVNILITQQTLNVGVGETGTLYVTPQNTDFTVSVSPASGSGCFKSGNNAVVCTPTAEGNYTVTVTATADPSKTSMATITVSAPPPAVSAPRTADISKLKRNVLIVYATLNDRTGFNSPKLNGHQIYDLFFNPNGNSVNDYYKELFGAAEDVILPANVDNPLDGQPGIIEVTLSGQYADTPTISQSEQWARVLAAAAGDGYVASSALIIGILFDIGPGYGCYAGNNSFTVPMTWYDNGTLVSNQVVGTICHEFGHAAYGFRDTYNFDSIGDGSSYGHGNWSLMSGRPGFLPDTVVPYVDAYNLVKSGIVIPGVISASEDNITINSHLDIYRVNSSVSNTQYFLLQQRKYGSTDKYDGDAFYSIGSSSNSGKGGLLIYHIDENTLGGVNDKNSHYGAAIVEAHGGLQHLRTVRPKGNYGDVNDLWGGSYNLFSNTSDPSSRLYGAYTNDAVPPVKNINSGIEIRDINWNSSAGNTSFSVVKSTPTESPSISVTPLTSFGPLQTPYIRPAIQTVTITNTGTNSATLTQPTARNFDIGQLSTNILVPGATATFTVCPKENLPNGNYNEEIAISGTGWARTTFIYANFAVTTAKSISTFTDLQNAINDYATTGNIVITVTRGFSINYGLYIPSGLPQNAGESASLTIRSENPQNPVTLTRGFTNGPLFYSDMGAILILEDIIIDGNMDAYPDNSGPLVRVNGDFVMKDGAILTNNAGGGADGDSGAYRMGGGVYLAGGNFTMTGGEISGNAAKVGSGGVYLAGGGFTMTGGEISGNTAEIGSGGVYVCGVESMKIANYSHITLGGTSVISGNTKGGTNNNVYLENGTYIMPSTDIPPISGMNVGVHSGTSSGVIVNSGARLGDEQYLFADESGKTVIFMNNQLVIR